MNMPQINTNKIQVSAHTRKIRRIELAARGVLWTAAGLTIGILLIIVGYIIFRGLVDNRKMEYDVITKGEKFIHVGKEKDEAISVIVNKKVKIKDLTMEDLIELFNGRRRDWGKISEQNLPVKVFSLKDGNASREYFDSFLFAGKPDYSRKTEFLSDEAAVVRRVATVEGGIGYISSKLAEKSTDKNIKVIPIRRIAIVANPEVLKLKNNMKLKFLTSSHLRKIFSGEASNWSQVGGTDLPMSVIAFNDNTNINREFNKLVMNKAPFGTKTSYVNTIDELKRELDRKPGAVAFVYYNDALADKLPIISIERHEIKPNLTWSFLFEEPKKAGTVGGISTIILNTVFMILLTLAFATPIGVGAAIYLTEYAKQGRIVSILRFGTETLAGIPSIIFGLFGFIFFVTWLRLGIGLLSGTLTITFMILPTIIRTAEEAIKTVPVSFREGSLALGATKWQTITGVVIPAAIPGILTGIILGIGRAVGETAALLFTMGTDYRLADGLSSSARVLSVHLYILAKEGLSFERAFATGTILILIILIINFSTNKLIGRMSKVRG